MVTDMSRLNFNFRVIMTHEANVGVFGVVITIPNRSVYVIRNVEQAYYLKCYQYDD